MENKEQHKNSDSEQNKNDVLHAASSLMGVFVQTLLFHQYGITASIATGMLIATIFAYQLAKASLFSGIVWLLLVGIASAVTHVVTFALFIR